MGTGAGLGSGVCNRIAFIGRDFVLDGSFMLAAEMGRCLSTGASVVWERGIWPGAKHTIFRTQKPPGSNPKESGSTVNRRRLA